MSEYNMSRINKEIGINENKLSNSIVILNSDIENIKKKIDYINQLFNKIEECYTSNNVSEIIEKYNLFKTNYDILINNLKRHVTDLENVKNGYKKFNSTISIRNRNN